MSECSETPCRHAKDSCAMKKYLFFMDVANNYVSYELRDSLSDMSNSFSLFPEIPKIPSADCRFTLQILTESFRSFVG
uniref:Dimethylallyltransferase n=1 Tax=Solanum tuberosum TaxID=4113 RepID=M1B521_SOLTU